MRRASATRCATEHNVLADDGGAATRTAKHQPPLHSVTPAPARCVKGKMTARGSRASAGVGRRARLLTLETALRESLALRRLISALAVAAASEGAEAGCVSERGTCDDIAAVRGRCAVSQRGHVPPRSLGRAVWRRAGVRSSDLPRVAGRGERCPGTASPLLVATTSSYDFTFVVVVVVARVTAVQQRTYVQVRSLRKNRKGLIHEAYKRSVRTGTPFAEE